jgi:hypothetical protein
MILAPTIVALIRANKKPAEFSGPCSQSHYVRIALSLLTPDGKMRWLAGAFVMLVQHRSGHLHRA